MTYWDCAVCISSFFSSHGLFKKFINLLHSIPFHFIYFFFWRNPRAISRIIVPFRKAGFSSVCTGDAVQSTRNYGTHNLRLLCCKPTSNHGCLAIQTHSTRVRNLHVNSVLRQRPEYENNISVTGSRSGNIEVQHDRMLLRYGEFDMELLYMWLRDHCRCEVCYNHSTYQKNVDNYKINPGERPVKVEFDGLLLTITCT